MKHILGMGRARAALAEAGAARRGGTGCTGGRQPSLEPGLAQARPMQRICFIYGYIYVYIILLYITPYYHILFYIILYNPI